MARYEICTIYEIDAGEKKYYTRLLNNDLYGVFEPIKSKTAEHRQKQNYQFTENGFYVEKYSQQKV